jgi:hypothetical protein
MDNNPGGCQPLGQYGNFARNMWTDPLRGYAYDSFNKDACLRLATVKNGRIVLPGGASYGVLVIPSAHAMSPDAGLMSAQVLKKLQQLVDDGATILLYEQPTRAIGMGDNAEVAKLGKALFTSTGKKGKVLTGAYTKDTFDDFGLPRDVIVNENTKPAKGIAWTHRSAAGAEIYFISNQKTEDRDLQISLRSSGLIPELWDALTGGIQSANWINSAKRTIVSVKLAANGSVFIVLRKKEVNADKLVRKANKPQKTILTLAPKWTVKFDPKFGGPDKPVVFDGLTDWSANKDSCIRYYSGTASYVQAFKWNGKAKEGVWLDVGKVANLADVYVNGINCGVAWTYPYRVNISKALKPGINQLKIEVTNTWANRLTGDSHQPKGKRMTWTNAPYRLDGKTLLPAGLLGPVTIVK